MSARRWGQWRSTSPYFPPSSLYRTRSSPIKRTGLIDRSSISPAAANGVQYLRNSSPIKVPGPTSMSARFCSGFNISSTSQRESQSSLRRQGKLLHPATEGPAAPGVGSCAVHRYVIHELELERFLLHGTADRYPVQ